MRQGGGQLGRNGYSRGLEHWDNLNAKDEEKSVLWLHCKDVHQAREDVKLTLKVEGAYNEVLERRLMERVRISNFRGESLMNRSNEMGGIRVERSEYRR